jgi:hypothetical protein
MLSVEPVAERPFSSSNEDATGRFRSRERMRLVRYLKPPANQLEDGKEFGKKTL